MKKIQLFHQNHGLSPLQKCQFWGFLKPTFLLFRKACLLDKTSKIVFSRFMTWEYRGLQRVTRGYKGLQRVTGGYRGLQWITRGYNGLQGAKGGYEGLQRVTTGYKGLQGVTRGYRGLQRIIDTFF